VDVKRDAIYSLQELNELTGVSVRTLQRLVKGGMLPARKLGHKVLILGADLLDSLPKVEPKRR